MLQLLLCRIPLRTHTGTGVTCLVRLLLRYTTVITSGFKQILLDLYSGIHVRNSTMVGLSTH